MKAIILDPEKTLCTILEKAQKVQNSDDTFPTFQEDSWELAEAVIAMNDWIVNGGFLPKIWRR